MTLAVAGNGALRMTLVGWNGFREWLRESIQKSWEIWGERPHNLITMTLHEIVSIVVRRLG